MTGSTRRASATRRATGPCGTAWRQTRAGLRLNVTVPANTTAELRMPAPSRWAVTEGGGPAEDADAVRFEAMKGEVAVFELGSGRYSFAVDRVLGDLGEARAAAAALQRRDLERAIDRAWRSHLRGQRAARPPTPSTTRSSAAGRLQGAEAVRRHLSAASARLLGARVELRVPAGEHVAGDALRVRVVLRNRGARRLDDLRSALEAPAAWAVEPAGAHARSVAPGRSAVHAYDVRIPAGAEAGAAELAGSLSYRHRRGTATLPVAATVDVLPAVALTGVEAAPAELGPGDVTTVRTVLRNRSDLPRSGTVAVEPPAGWAPPAPTPYELPPGGERTVETAVPVPLAVTEGAATLTVSAGGQQATAELDVVFDNPPAAVLDHVDLGDASSEQAHGLTASPASGTSTEAGLTRRYTNATQPGGWFELDLRVPAGEPFVLRAIETYDQAALKTYDVLVDGRRVLARAHRRTAAGAGDGQLPVRRRRAGPQRGRQRARALPGHRSGPRPLDRRRVGVARVMRRLGTLLAAAAAALVLAAPAAAAGGGFDAARFAAPPSDSRPSTLWFWNGTVTPAIVDHQLADMRAPGRRRGAGLPVRHAQPAAGVLQRGVVRAHRAHAARGAAHAACTSGCSTTTSSPAAAAPASSSTAAPTGDRTYEPRPDLRTEVVGTAGGRWPLDAGGDAPGCASRTAGSWSTPRAAPASRCCATAPTGRTTTSRPRSGSSAAPPA